MKNKIILFASIAIVFFSACKKDKTTQTAATQNPIVSGNHTAARGGQCTPAYSSNIYDAAGFHHNGMLDTLTGSGDTAYSSVMTICSLYCESNSLTWDEDAETIGLFSLYEMSQQPDLNAYGQALVGNLTISQSAKNQLLNLFSYAFNSNSYSTQTDSYCDIKDNIKAIEDYIMDPQNQISSNDQQIVLRALSVARYSSYWVWIHVANQDMGEMLQYWDVIMADVDGYLQAYSQGGNSIVCGIVSAVCSNAIERQIH